MIRFSLKPYKETPLIDSFTGTFRLSTGQLMLGYQLEGDLDLIQWPVPVDKPVRKSGLWRETCFELFISSPSDTSYSEFNYSPTGQWQCFSFSDYRNNMSQSNEISLIKSQFIREGNRVSVDLALSLSGGADVEGGKSSCLVGLSAILLDQGNNYHYFALAHGIQKPDFHLKSTHVLELPIDI